MTHRIWTREDDPPLVVGWVYDVPEWSQHLLMYAGMGNETDEHGPDTHARFTQLRRHTLEQLGSLWVPLPQHMRPDTWEAPLYSIKV